MKVSINIAANVVADSVIAAMSVGKRRGQLQRLVRHPDLDFTPFTDPSSVTMEIIMRFCFNFNSHSLTSSQLLKGLYKITTPGTTSSMDGRRKPLQF